MNEPVWTMELGTSGVLEPGRHLKLRAVAWAIFLSACAMAFFLSTQYLGTWLHLPRGSSYVIDLGIPLLAFVGYAALIQVAERRKATEVWPDSRMVSEVAVGALLGFVMLCVMTALLWSLGLYSVQRNHWQHVFDSFVFNSYLSGMMEELMFRGILLRILGRAFGLRWGLVLSAALFGLAHLGHGSWLEVTEIAVNAGISTGLLYMVSGRLWMSIGLHVAWDFTEDSLLGVNSHNGLLRSMPVAGKPDLLTGGAYGPDGSLLAVLVGAAMIAVILYGSKAIRARR